MALLREEVAQLQEEVHLLRQMKEMLTKDLEETHGSKSPEVLSATELKVQLAQKEQELARAKEALQARASPKSSSSSQPAVLHPSPSPKAVPHPAALAAASLCLQQPTIHGGAQQSRSCYVSVSIILLPKD
ncbi:hypothetical protein IHE44_0007902 [Lamprotornis superbus]|uniref:Kazrin N-terminal domain-containing protein n=1 Tax=Lamprotornis superbus TaxID=245042 RepID=A0A835NQ07_9PASS|nr:hypothetical protein IHE44_0007902 [Lamprotornis superbus]